MDSPRIDYQNKLAQAEACAREKLRGALRPLQREVLSHLSEGRNVFAALPTGYGKSLCFWAPAAAWGWRVWVLSPLVSLMEDQVLAGAELGLPVVALHSGIPREERRERERRLDEGGPLICFLTPERLQRWEENGRLRALLDMGLGPDLLALDEMHCFEDWREFRKSYGGLFAAVRRLRSAGASLLGLSASMAAAASEAWMQELGGGHARVAAELGRENLVLRVFPFEAEEERWLLLATLLRDRAAGETVLLYTSTRAECDALARWLSSLGFPACAYHAGLPASLRAERSRNFRSGNLPYICATTAFGMGVDYPHVSRVIHVGAPYDLDGYWQEAGRAGRDGRVAYACALWSRADIARAERMSERQRERYFELWQAWLGGVCRKRAVAASLGLRAEACGRCDRCDPKAQGAPPWLRAAITMRAQEAWWIRAEAQATDWAREKIFRRG